MDDAHGALHARTQIALAIEKLRADIVRVQFGPGEKLRVLVLAKRYGVAANTVREALSRLVADGLVVYQNQRGFHVCPVSRDDLIDLTETRIGIECQALTRAMQYGDVAWEAQIAGAMHRLSRHSELLKSKADDVSPWASCHRDFHRALIAGCKSPRLLQICEQLHTQTERYRHLAHYKAPEGRDALYEHHRLAEVVSRRDTAMACQLLSDHFRETTRIILESDRAAAAGRVASQWSAAKTARTLRPRSSARFRSAIQ